MTVNVTSLGMNVKQLKALIDKLPDNMNIVVPGQDHSYDIADISVISALVCMGSYTEDHGEKLTPEKEYGKRVDVLVVTC